MPGDLSEDVGDVKHLGWPWWRWVLTGLSVLALALSAYLGWHYVVGGSVIGCGPAAAGCEQVLSGRWSTIGGVLPVSGLAAGIYLAMLSASLFIGPATAAPVRRLAWGAMLVLVGAAAGSAVWFTIVQKWIIGAFCPYCLAVHTTGLLLAALVLWQAPRQPDDESTGVAPSRNDLVGVLARPQPDPLSRHGGKSEPTTAIPGNGSRRCASPSAGTTSPSPGGEGRGEGDRGPSTDSFRPGNPAPAPAASPGASRRIIGLRPAIGRALVGLALAGLLAASQVAWTPPAVYRSGESRSKLSAIDPHAAPRLGSPDAQYVVTLLFDYKCTHCQQMHFLLGEAIRRYSGKLAFALCPAPLNRECNPYVPRDVDEFKDSCELARVGLAVWRARREALPAFDNWMFSFESGDRWRPRSLDAARAKAVELVGQAKLDAARVDPWIDRYLQTSIRMFADTGSNAIPKLVFGSRWVIPEPYDADGLVMILQDILAVPKP